MKTLCLLFACFRLIGAYPNDAFGREARSSRFYGPQRAFQNPYAISSRTSQKTYVFDLYKGFVPDPEVKAAEEEEGKTMGEEKRFVFDPYYGFVDAKKKPDRTPQFIHNSYHGYIPVPDKDTKKIIPGVKFVLSQSYGYIPAADEDEESAEDPEFTYSPRYGFVPHASADGKTLPKFMRHRRFGFIPAEIDEDIKSNSEDGQLEFMYHPYYGFIPAPADDIMGEENRKRYVFDPLRGYTLKSSKETEAAPQMYVYHSQLGFVPFRTLDKKDDEQKYKADPYYGYIPLSSDNGADDKDDKVFIRHPYYGFILASDSKENETFVYSPLYGFVPKDELDNVETQQPGKFFANLYGPSSKPVINLKQQLLAAEPAIEPDIDTKIINKRSAQFPALTGYFGYPMFIPAFSPQPYAFIDPFAPLARNDDALPVNQTTPNVEGSPAKPAVGPTLFDPVIQSSVIVPPGSVLSNETLPENAFPIFPYDPNQDAPGVDIL